MSLGTGSDAGNGDADPAATSPAVDVSADPLSGSGAESEHAAVVDSVPDAPAAPAPAVQSYPTADDIARANYSTFGPIFQQMVPRPAPPEMPWKDPGQYWNMPSENPQAAFHERVTKYAEHIAEARVAPLIQRIQQLEGAFQYAQARFATDPNFSKIEARFQELVYDRVPPHHARRYAELEMGQASPNQASPTTPRPIPMPPRHATSPATRTSAPQAPARDRSKMPTIEDSFKRSGAGRFLGTEL